MILVVEDDEINRDLMVAALEPLGHDVIACASAEEALRELDRRTFALIFTDRSLPGADGLALIRAVRAHPGGRTPIVMISGDESPEAAEVARAAGADGYLPKPVRLGALLAEAGRLLGRSG